MFFFPLKNLRNQCVVPESIHTLPADFSYRVATHQKRKNSLTFYWTIFTDLKLVRWMIKKTLKTTDQNYYSSKHHPNQSFCRMLSDRKYNSLTFHWLLQIFPDLLQNSLILKNVSFSLTFPWLWQSCHMTPPPPIWKLQASFKHCFKCLGLIKFLTSFNFFLAVLGLEE